MKVLVEDPGMFLNFYPFSLSHAVWELRIGIFTIYELWKQNSEEPIVVYTPREYLIPILKARGYPVIEKLPEDVEQIKANLLPDGTEVKWLYEAIYLISERIEKEWELIDYADTSEYQKKVKLLSPENIKIGEDVEIAPYVVVDASRGKVFIDNGVHIQSFVYLRGPLYIGEKTLIKSGASISYSSIGKVCKLGGEMEDTIVYGYSNAQHESFIGHSFIGEWVNIGAYTITSDLKNNYKPVKLRIRDKLIDTGKIHLGSFIGDHVKTGINTMLNTGTVIGFSSNVFGSDYQPKFIPSFTWKAEPELFELMKAMETARIMMARRNKLFTEADAYLFKALFQIRKEKGL